MKKRLVLRKGIEKVLETICVLWIVFVATTIESLGNPQYNLALIIVSAITIPCSVVYIMFKEEM